MSGFVKLLNRDLVHNGMVYKEGLNTDVLPFNPQGSCESGGLYYSTITHVWKWLSIDHHFFIADVDVPNDTQTWEEPCGTKWKSHSIILRNITPLVHWFGQHLHEAIRAQSVNPDAWRFIQGNAKLCLDLVKIDGLLLHGMFFVLTQDLVEAAIEQNPRAIIYTHHYCTEDLWVKALRKDGWCIDHGWTERTMMAAIEGGNLYLNAGKNRWIEDAQRAAQVALGFPPDFELVRRLPFANCYLVPHGDQCAWRVATMGGVKLLGPFAKGDVHAAEELLKNVI